MKTLIPYPLDHRWRALLAIATVVLTCRDANAADRFWRGPGSTAIFHTSGNWSPTVVPGTADRAVFDSIRADSLLTNNTTIQSILVNRTTQDARADLDISAGRTLTVNNGVTLSSNAGLASAQLNLKSAGTLRSLGNTNINSGGLVFVAQNSSYTEAGTINVANNGYLYNTLGLIESKNLVIQSGGFLIHNLGGTIRVQTGILDVRPGAAITNYDLAGTLEFTNGASTSGVSSIKVGGTNYGGTMNILTGSSVSTANSTVGSTSTSNNHGIVLVSGTGSQWQNSQSLAIGTSVADGTLNILSNGTVSTGILTTNSRGNVGVNNGTLNAGTWNIGKSVTQTGGTIDVGILNGAQTITTTGATRIGDATNWNLTSTIAGAGTTRKEGNGIVTATSGGIFTSNLAIDDSGTLALTSGNRIGDSTAVVVSSSGKLNLASSGIEIIGSLSGAGQVNLGSGTLATGWNNSSTAYSGVISGTGGSIKQGSGTFTLSGANTYSGTTQISSGTLAIGANERISNSSAVTIASGATLNTTGFQETVGSLSGSGNVNLGGSAILAAGGDDTNTTFSGAFTGNGTLRKKGNGTMTLSGQSGLTGSVVVQSGTLKFAANNVVPNLTTVGIGLGVGSGAVLDVNGTTQQVGLVGNDGSVNLNGGSLTATNSYSNLGTTNVGSGQLSGGTLTNFSTGIIQVGNGGALQANTLDNQLGTIFLASGAVLSSANVINDGTIIGDFTIGLGQQLSGNGYVNGELTVHNGGVVSPGNSIDTMTIDDLRFGPDGNLVWEISDTIGAPGSSWDAFIGGNTLDITAIAANPFEIDLISFGGPMANFIDTQDYAWTIVSTAGGITGFDPNKFLLDSSGIQNSFSGTFGVAQSGDNLNLTYTAAVPEPGTFSVLVAVSALASIRRRRRTA